MNIEAVLDRAWRQPFRTKSDFAREHADAIAALASDGLLTTRLAPGQYDRKWMITVVGLSHLLRMRDIAA